MYNINKDTDQTYATEGQWCQHVAAAFYCMAHICDDNAYGKAGAYHIFKMRGIDLFELCGGVPGSPGDFEANPIVLDE